MKRIFVLILAFVFCFALTACTENNEPQSATEASSEKHQIPQSTSSDEPQWCLIGCDNIYISDVENNSGNIVVPKENFTMFALNKIDKENKYGFIFKLNEQGTQQLSDATLSGSDLFIIVNGELFSKITYSQQIIDGEITVTFNESFEELSSWADTIRGF